MRIVNATHAESLCWRFIPPHYSAAYLYPRPAVHCVSFLRLGVPVDRLAGTFRTHHVCSISTSLFARPQLLCLAPSCTVSLLLQAAGPTSGKATAPTVSSGGGMPMDGHPGGGQPPWQSSGQQQQQQAQPPPPQQQQQRSVIKLRALQQAVPAGGVVELLVPSAGGVTGVVYTLASATGSQVSKCKGTSHMYMKMRVHMRMRMYVRSQNAASQPC